MNSNPFKIADLPDVEAVRNLLIFVSTLVGKLEEMYVSRHELRSYSLRMKK